MGTEKDLTIRSLEYLRKCEFIYLENYTSKLGFSENDLINLLGNGFNGKIILSDRILIESGYEILNNSKNYNCAVLVKGDAFSATTHIDLYLRAKKENIKVEVIHNSSILTAVGDTGLSLYKFGKTASIPFNYKNIFTPFEIYLENGSGKNMHTLFLLDLDPKNNKYMNFKEGLNYFKENGDGSINLDTNCVICAAIGTEEQIIKYGKIKDLLNVEINVYPQCIIIPGKLHFMEEEMLELFK